MKPTTLFTLVSIAAAMFTGAAQAEDTDTFTSTHGLTFGAGTLKRAGETIWAEHVRTVHSTDTWLRERRYVETPILYSVAVRPRWTPYRSPYARRTNRPHSAPFLHTYVVPFRHELSCRYLADCPCRYLAGC